MAAILHDTVEDTNWTLDQLRSQGYPDIVVELVSILTRVDDESYEDYIERIKNHPDAIKIKLADLEDNMDVRRLSDISDHDFRRIKRYHTHWISLREELEKSLMD